jgi:exonuclease III
MNAQSKLIATKSKIKEANCDIICLQETKRRILMQISLKHFAHRVLTILNSSHLLELQGAQSLFGKVFGLVEQ